MAKIIDKTEGLLSNPKRAMAWAIVVTVVVVLFFVFKSKNGSSAQRYDYH